jgi:hypothetical protein
MIMAKSQWPGTPEGREKAIAAVMNDVQED